MCRLALAILLVGAVQAGAPRAAYAADVDPVVVYTTIAGYPAQIEIFIAPQSGVDPAAAAAELLRAAHVSPTPSDLFFTEGFVWAQFLDHGRQNDFVTQSYNPDGDPTGGAALAALLATQQTWSDVLGTTFRFAFGGTTTRCPSLIFFCPGGSQLDGHNDIGWLPLPFSILGLSATVFNPFTGEALESDVILNNNIPAPFGWFTDGRDIPGIDVMTVMLHEDGHFAGLAHTPDPSAVMFPFYTGVKRVLTAAETDGLIFLYPPKPSTVSHTPSAFDFRVLAALGDAAPGGGEYLNDFEPDAVNGSADVAFVADVPEGEALFVARNGGVTQVVRSGQVAPGGATLGFGSIDRVALNDAGDLAFSWALEPFVTGPFGANAGLFRADVGGSVQALVLPGITPAPGGGVFEGSSGAGLSNNGDVAFAGLVHTAQGQAFGIFLARRDGSIDAVARPGDPAPGGGTFLSTGFASIGGSGDVAFVARVTGVTGFGVYVRRAPSGVIEAIARPGDPVPGGGVFERAILPRVNARGEVLFAGGVRQGRFLVFGLFLAGRGGIVPIAQPGDVMPDGWRFLRLVPTTFGGTLNDNGDVAFVARTVQENGFQGEAVYASSHGALRLVARPGSVILGIGDVGSVSPLFPAAVINNRGDVVLQVQMFLPFSLPPRQLLLEAGPKAR